MTTIQKQAAEKAIALLNASGAQYKVIFADGTEYGDLEVVQKKRTRVVRLAYGSLHHLYRDKVDACEVGGVIQIPLDELPPLGAEPKSLRSAVTAYASSKWGNNSYISTITDKHLEVLRYA